MKSNLDYSSGHVPRPRFATYALLLLTTLMTPCWAAPRIAVLDFELKDLTLLPDSPEEIERTASIRPFLENALSETADVHIVEIDSAAMSKANVGFGYLFEHPDVAATLGKQHGAEWVVVGRLHKPSHLFAYLMVHLIDVGTGALAENIIVEVKGQQHIVNKKGAERLAKKILHHITQANQST